MHSFCFTLLMVTKLFFNWKTTWGWRPMCSNCTFHVKTAEVGDFHDCFPHANIIFCFLGKKVLSLFLCVTIDCPLPTPQLSAMLQSAKLLWVSLARHMLSLFPLTIILLTTTRAHACIQTAMASICFGVDLLDVKKWHDLCCAGVIVGQSMISRAYSRLMRIALQHRRGSAKAHAWMHWRAHTNTDVSLWPS